MNSTQEPTQATTPNQTSCTSKQQQLLSLEQCQKKPTFGQRLADKMASKVGSWAFIGTQSVILAGWIGANTMPGVPHWDESPFILLNLVFSFASAYTAPVVLMSQNRQSDEDRDSAAINHKVNLQTAQAIELLHQKFDDLQTHQLAELAELLRQRVTIEPVATTQEHTQSYFVGEVEQKSKQIGSIRDERKPKTVSVFLPQTVFNFQDPIVPLASNLQAKQKFSDVVSHSSER
jgi:uncharacterized membrane protein